MNNFITRDEMSLMSTITMDGLSVLFISTAILAVVCYLIYNLIF